MTKAYAVLLPVVFALALLPVGAELAQAQDYHCHVVVDATGFTMRCDVATPPAPPVTETPLPPTLPPPTPTAEMSADMNWHAPGTHGDRPFHEHGDSPPAWLTAAGYSPMFTHAAGTPGENMAYYKHTAFKGWAGTFNGQEWYGVFHLDSNPVGQNGRFHSYQLWVKDATGAVSAFSGWLDFGTGDNLGPQKVVVCEKDSGIRPIIMVNQAGCGPVFENWYARAGVATWGPDIGFNIQATYFDIGTADATNPDNWQSINGRPNNLTRRIEWAWYAARSAQRGTFYTDQWGTLVSGPADPVCGTLRTIGGRAYTILCLKQVVQPTLQSVEFPGNSEQFDFPGEGVVLPN